MRRGALTGAFGTILTGFLLLPSQGQSLQNTVNGYACLRGGAPQVGDGATRRWAVAIALHRVAGGNCGTRESFRVESENSVVEPWCRPVGLGQSSLKPGEDKQVPGDATEPLPIRLSWKTLHAGPLTNALSASDIRWRRRVPTADEEVEVVVRLRWTNNESAAPLSGFVAQSGKGIGPFSAGSPLDTRAWPGPWTAATIQSSFPGWTATFDDPATGDRWEIACTSDTDGNTVLGYTHARRISLQGAAGEISASTFRGIVSRVRVFYQLQGKGQVEVAVFERRPADMKMPTERLSNWLQFSAEFQATRDPWYR